MPRPEFLLGLPIDHFTSLIKSDELFVASEFELVEVVKKCLQFHQEKGEKLPILPEEAAGPDVWARLSDAEKKARKDIYDKEVAAIKLVDTN